MRPTSTFFTLCLLTILNTFHGVICLQVFKNVRFSRAHFLDGNMCNNGSIIQDTSNVGNIECLTLCSSQSPCVGVFFEPDVKRCVTCSALFFTNITSTGSKFYKRHDVTDVTVVSIYLLVTQRSTWYTAKQNCENIGGHLLIITSEEENEFIVQHLDALDGIDVISIGAKGTGGRAESFKWVDGSALSGGYTNWRVGQPYPQLTVERYTTMLREWNYKWNDGGDEAFTSICEFE